MAKTNNHLVIMAGGVGSRFWPMSTSENPKQFIDVLGVGKTLLQLTVDRFGDLVLPQNTWVVTNQKYAAIVKEQLPNIPENNILCEPCRRNTAPCIAYVSWKIKSKDPKANIVVTPSDHIVTDKAEFQRVVKECMLFTSETDAIVTLGMNTEWIRSARNQISRPHWDISRRTTISGMQASLSGTSTPSSMLSVSTSPQWLRSLSRCSPSMVRIRSRRLSTNASPSATISLSTMPSWRKQKRFSSVLPTLAGVIWAPGVLCVNKARKTFTETCASATR